MSRQKSDFVKNLIFHDTVRKIQIYKYFIAICYDIESKHFQNHLLEEKQSYPKDEKRQEIDFYLIIDTILDLLIFLLLSQNE